MVKKLIIILLLLIYFIFYNFFIIEKFDDKNTYLIYRSSGGLIHNLSGLSKAVDICIKNNCILLIDSEQHVPFGVKFSDMFNLTNLKKKVKILNSYDEIKQNYKFNNYNISEIKKFKIKFNKNNKYCVNGINIQNITIKKNKINMMCTHGNLNHIKKLDLKINNNLKIIIKKKVNDLNLPKEYISVHFRNTDIKTNDTHIKNQILNTISKFKVNDLYLATDDYYFYNKIKNIPNLKIYRNTYPPKNIKNLHYLNTKNSKDKLIDLFIDMYCIYNSTYFIPSNKSGLSKYLKNSIQDNNNFFDIDTKKVIII